MLRLLPLLLLIALAATAAPALAKKPVTINLYHVTEVQMDGAYVLRHTGPEEGETGEWRGTTRVHNTKLSRRGWRGKRNAGFWGSDGWGVLGAPLGDGERWQVTGYRTWVESEWDSQNSVEIKTPVRKDCQETSRPNRSRGSRDVGVSIAAGFTAKIAFPRPLDPLRCLGDPIEYKIPAIRELQYKVKLDPAKQRGRVARIPFERTFELETHKRDWSISLSYKGRFKIERGYSCRTPPDFPCHTMLM